MNRKQNQIRLHLIEPARYGDMVHLKVPENSSERLFLAIDVCTGSDGTLQMDEDRTLI